MLYVVKKKYKHQRPQYTLKYTSTDVEFLRSQSPEYTTLRQFMLTLPEARQIWFNIIRDSVDGWDQELEYVSIVELSHYAGFREYQVIEYREFK